MMYYIVYVFQGAGINGRHGVLIASSIQYVLNVVMTIPAILWIDKWGRRPMLLFGFAMMSFWLGLVGGLQGVFGHWGILDNSRIWVITDHKAASRAIIASSYLFVCSFAITVGPVSWTYPAEIFPVRVRSKGVALSTASNWAFNTALAWAVPPALANISYRTYFIFAAFNAGAALHVFFMFPETKGRTLEEIEEVFNVGHVFSAGNISPNVGRKNLQDVIAPKGLHDKEETLQFENARKV